MLPAARLTDTHTCPMWTGVVPHVGGPLTAPGQPTLMIAMIPAARSTDAAVCSGPPDTQASGSPAVLMQNMPAARMTDLTGHGGVLTAPGAPTVLIGGPAPPAPPPPPDPPEGMTPEEIELMQGGASEEDLAKFREEQAKKE